MLLEYRVRYQSLGQTATVRSVVSASCLGKLCAAQGWAAAAVRASSSSRRSSYTTSRIESGTWGGPRNVSSSGSLCKHVTAAQYIAQPGVGHRWRHGTALCVCSSCAGSTRNQPSSSRRQCICDQKWPHSIHHRFNPAGALGTASNTAAAADPAAAAAGWKSTLAEPDTASKQSSTNNAGSSITEPPHDVASTCVLDCSSSSSSSNYDDALGQAHNSQPSDSVAAATPSAKLQVETAAPQQPLQQQLLPVLPGGAVSGAPKGRPRPRRSTHSSHFTGTAGGHHHHHHHHHHQQPARAFRQPPAAVSAPAPVAAVVQAEGNVRVRGIVRSITHEGDHDFKIIRVQVVESSTDPAVGSEALTATQAALAAATAGSKKGRSGGNSSSVRECLTVKGILPGVATGAELQLWGNWENHHIHGWQMRLRGFEELPPADLVLYLSGCWPGVGVATAERIVRGLAGQDVIQVLNSDTAAEKLAAIKGIGPKQALKHKKNWDNSRGYNEALTWLLQQRLPRTIAITTAQRYKLSVKSLAMHNPYHFNGAVPGFMLKHSEVLAESLGFAADAPERAAAVLHQVLHNALYREGQTVMDWVQLQHEARALMEEVFPLRPWPDGSSLRPGAELLVKDGKVVVEEVHQLAASSQHDGQQQQQQAGLFQFMTVTSGWGDSALLMLTRMHTAESDVVKYLLSSAAACHAVLERLGHGHSSSRQNNSRSSRNSTRQRSRRNSRSTTSNSSNSSGLVALTPKLLDVIRRCEAELSYELGGPVSFNEGQRQVVALAASLPVMVLTGGPGCGKTLTSRAVARAWQENSDMRLALAAPTGRAAQRLREQVSGCMSLSEANASTIHRLLGFKGHKAWSAATDTADSNTPPPSAAAVAATATEQYDGFNVDCLWEYNCSNRLPFTRLLIDEVSMMDTQLAAALFNAISATTKVLLVGDPDQLPPVGAGRPLAAALAAGVLPCVDLRHIYRSAASSSIVNAAHAINQGRMPEITTWELSPLNLERDLADHISAVPRNDRGKLMLSSNAIMLRLPDDVHVDKVRDAMLLVVRHIVPLLDCNPQLDVQVLSPTKRTPVGTLALNHQLQDLLNPSAHNKQQVPVAEHQQSGSGSSSSSSSDVHVWRVGDRVIHLENDPDREVYNGDLGYIESITTAGSGNQRRMVVRYPSRSGAAAFHRVTYEAHEIKDQLQLAWATTVHKAQGGEFPIVMMPLHTSTYCSLLQRPLLYTAVSRAKQLLLLVGTDAALQQCIHRVSESVGPDSLVSQQPLEQSCSSNSSGWLRSVQGDRFYEKLRSEAAARGLKPFPRLVYGPGGLLQQQAEKSHAPGTAVAYTFSTEQESLEQPHWQ